MSDPDLNRFNSQRSTIYGARGVVAASPSLAAENDIEMSQTGVNAFDAAVATAAALNVVEPTSTELDSDVFALYRIVNGQVGGLRSCGGAPLDRGGHDVSVLHTGMFGGGQIVCNDAGILSRATKPRKDSSIGVC